MEVEETGKAMNELIDTHITICYIQVLRQLRYLTYPMTHLEYASNSRKRYYFRKVLVFFFSLNVIHNKNIHETHHIQQNGVNVIII